MCTSLIWWHYKHPAGSNARIPRGRPHILIQRSSWPALMPFVPPIRPTQMNISATHRPAKSGALFFCKTCTWGDWIPIQPPATSYYTSISRLPPLQPPCRINHHNIWSDPKSDITSTHRPNNPRLAYRFVTHSVNQTPCPIPTPSPVPGPGPSPRAPRHIPGFARPPSLPLGLSRPCRRLILYVLVYQTRHNIPTSLEPVLRFATGLSLIPTILYIANPVCIDYFQAMHKVKDGFAWNLSPRV